VEVDRGQELGEKGRYVWRRWEARIPKVAGSRGNMKKNYAPLHGKGKVTHKPRRLTRPELFIPVSVAGSNEGYCYSPLDGIVMSKIQGGSHLCHHFGIAVIFSYVGFVSPFLPECFTTRKENSLVAG